MQNLISYFFSDFNLKFQTLWFKRLLYVFLIITCAYWLVYYDLLFGSHAVFYAKPYPVAGFRDFAYLLYASPSASPGLYFIIAVLILSLINLAWPNIYFISDLIIWFLVINLHNKIYASLTGGDYLLNQFLCFNCFLSAGFSSNGSWQNALKKALHNFGIVAVMLQVIVVYALSALAKLNDPDWLGGRAVLLVSQTAHFALFPMAAVPSRMVIHACMILNYGVLFYQCSFPFLIWLKKIKKPFIIAGILMHLYIAFVMGLVSFGLIMIVGYIYFWPAAKSSGSLRP